MVKVIMYECDICYDLVFEPREHSINKHDGEGMFETLRIKMSAEERDMLYEIYRPMDS